MGRDLRNFGVCLWRNLRSRRRRARPAEASGLVRERFKCANGETCARIWRRDPPQGPLAGCLWAELGVADAPEDWAEGGGGGRDANAWSSAPHRGQGRSVMRISCGMVRSAARTRGRPSI